MQIKTGCDLVKIERFKKSVERGGEQFLRRIFSSHELSYASCAETRAGIFAAKEAVIKALDLGPGSWHEVEICKDSSGRPFARVLNRDHTFISQDISISHDGGYAIATAVFLFENTPHIS